MIGVILLLILLGVITHFVVLHYGKFGRMVNSIPGPKALPLLGNMHTFHVSSCDLWKVIREMSKQYYPIFRLWAFLAPFVNIRHPDDVETVIGNNKSTQKSHIYSLLHPWFRTGLLTSSGQKWYTRRKILTPAFHFNVLKEFVDIFIEESERFVKTLKNEKIFIVKDLVHIISEHTLNIICETAMGTSLKDKNASFQHKYRKAVYDMGQIAVYRYRTFPMAANALKEFSANGMLVIPRWILNTSNLKSKLVRPWLQRDDVFKLFPKGWEQMKLLKILHGFTNQIIQERKQYHDQTNGQYLSGLSNDPNEQNNGEIKKKRLAMLDLLIAAHRNNQIDDEGIREEVDTFMFRGHDTTAMSICFTILLLAEHKEIQEQARIEVNRVMEEHGGKMTMSTLQNLPYLERCIKESLRLYPSVPFISRAPENQIRLSNYVLPADTVVHVHIADVHRDPQYWPNPDIFDPDRFLPENMKGRHPYSYVPFSAGPRNCIGQRFAMFELKTVIGLLLHNFYLEPVDYLKDITITTDLVLRPAHPVRTKFIPIENNTC